MRAVVKRYISPSKLVNILEILNKIYYFKIKLYCRVKGFYPGGKKTIDLLFNKIEEKSKLESFEALKKVAWLASIDNNHHYYNLLLERLFLDNNLKYVNYSFVAKGAGFGQSSWNSFRRIQIDNNIYFEKVYVVGHEDLKRVLWFQKNAIHFFKEIKTPKLKFIFSSNIAAITYFEYLKLTEIVSSKENKLIELSKKLYDISSRNQEILSQINKPDFIMDIQTHYIIKRHWTKVVKYFDGNEVNMEATLAKLYNSKHLITHGDLGLRNSYKDNILLDWDNFGYYPLGMDVAIIFHFNVENKNKIYDFEEWLNNNYKETISVDDWGSFYFNFVFYLFIFNFRYDYKKDFTSIQSFLVDKLLINLK